ncbi:22507_t:CDS:2, partial [Gigaspora rosea]
TYDIVTSKIKYTEGFMMIPYTGDIITKPVVFWNDDNLKLVTPINYILCANFSAQTCLLFLLQSFWNYLANNIAKTTFMGIVPQFAYGIILLIIALLGVRSHWRFTRLLRITRSANSSQLSIEMNRYLTWGLFIGATSMIILCVDAFTPQKYINSHKFLQDLFLCHLNFTIWI